MSMTQKLSASPKSEIKILVERFFSETFTGSRMMPGAAEERTAEVPAAGDSEAAAGRAGRQDARSTYLVVGGARVRLGAQSGHGVPVIGARPRDSGPGAGPQS